MSVKAINSCTLNSQNAGLNNLIPFEVVSLDELSIDKLYTVITNPPWGKRLGIASIDRVWLGLGSMLSKGQDIYMLLPDMHETDFSFSYTTLLRFTSGDINVKFVKVKEKI